MTRRHDTAIPGRHSGAASAKSARVSRPATELGRVRRAPGEAASSGERSGAQGERHGHRSSRPDRRHGRVNGDRRPGDGARGPGNRDHRPGARAGGPGIDAGGHEPADGADGKPSPHAEWPRRLRDDPPDHRPRVRAHPDRHRAADRPAPARCPDRQRAGLGNPRHQQDLRRAVRRDPQLECPHRGRLDPRRRGRRRLRRLDDPRADRASGPWASSGASRPDPRRAHPRRVALRT